MAAGLIDHGEKGLREDYDGIDVRIALGGATLGIARLGAARRHQPDTPSRPLLLR